MDNKAVAFYIRLSVEDSKTGSFSIEGQRKILTEHLKTLPEYEYAEVLEFIDNGFTGTNFERPAMTELIDKVNKNQISCILVKDFSRLVAICSRQATFSKRYSRYLKPDLSLSAKPMTAMSISTETAV